MIQFLKKRNTAWVRILADTAIKGTHVKKGKVLEVSADDADALLGSERAEIVDAPKPKAEKAPEGSDEETTDKQTKKAAK